MILECRNLTKSYRGKRAVSNLNVRLEEGKIYGLLGGERKRQDYVDENDGRACKAFSGRDIL